MANNKRKYNRNKGAFFGNNFWQSADFNLRTFRQYRDWLYGIALNRIKWIGLPDTCSARFLEYTLLREGVACIARPKNKKFKDTKILYSTRVMFESAPNVYDDYTKFISVGNNGWQFKSDNKNGVIVWNNQERLPILNEIDLFARRLTYFDRIIDSNLNAQRNPIVITGEQQQTNVITQMVKQVQGGEPVIAGFKGINNLDIQALNMNVPFISEKIEMVKEQLFQQFYTFIGVQNTPRKAERMIEEEVTGFTEPIQMRKLDALSPRREAAEKLNKMFGLNIKVVWNSDIETSNYNVENNKSLEEFNEDNKESKDEQ